MNAEKLMDAIGYVDDKYILEADKLRNKKTTTYSLRHIALIAACIALLILCTSLYFITRESGNNIIKDNPPPIIQENAVEIEKETETEISPPLDEPEDFIEETDDDHEQESNSPGSDLLNDESEGTVSPENVYSCSYKGIIVSFTSDGFMCKIADSEEAIHIIYPESTLILSIGDTVTIFTKTSVTDSTEIIALSVCIEQ